MSPSLVAVEHETYASPSKVPAADARASIRRRPSTVAEGEIHGKRDDYDLATQRARFQFRLLLAKYLTQASRIALRTTPGHELLPLI